MTASIIASLLTMTLALRSFPGNMVSDHNGFLSLLPVSRVGDVGNSITEQINVLFMTRLTRLEDRLKDEL